MMPSITSRNPAGSSSNTNRLAMKRRTSKTSRRSVPLSTTSTLTGQTVLGHLKRDDDAFGAPVARDRSAEFDGHATVEKPAAVSAFTCVSFHCQTAAFCLNHHHVGVMRRA